MKTLNGAVYRSLTPQQRAEVDRALARGREILEQDPLQSFEPNCDEQAKFLSATTRTQAAFCGNQAGKTTALIVKALAQVTPRERLPERLRPYKRFDGQVYGRIVNPGAKQLKNTLLPAFRQWTPKHICRNGSFDDSWSTQDQTLTFSDGSFIDFLTYETDLDKFGGPQRHFLGYDEPPPREIRDEGLARLTRFGGFEMFSLTPLKANTGWIKRDIWRQREASEITVAKWSIHDNKALSEEAVRYFLDSLPNDLWRRAREFGDFVDVGGLIYPQFEEAVVKTVEPDWRACHEAFKGRVQVADVVVVIDPGLRNAAFVWLAFDRDNRALAFDEVLLQQKYAQDYARAIRQKNAQWGLKEDQITYVIDPNYRVRGQASPENVESALQREGIYVVPAPTNKVEYGCMETGQRLSAGMLQISPICMGLRDEADLYAMEDRDDGVFKEVDGSSFHHLDALRYGCVYRTWNPHQEAGPKAPLGWVPGEMPALKELRSEPEYGPMGQMS